MRYVTIVLRKCRLGIQPPDSPTDTTAKPPRAPSSTYRESHQ